MVDKIGGWPERSRSVVSTAAGGDRSCSPRGRCSPAAAEGTARRRQDRRAGGVGAGDALLPVNAPGALLPASGATLMATPGARDIARRDGKLEVEGLAVADLARRFGTPLYVYSSAAMARRSAPYQRALAGRDPRLLRGQGEAPAWRCCRWFARQGCGFDIVSGGELERVLAAGGDASRVVFSGVGKTSAEMRRALAVDVLCFNVESVCRDRAAGRSRRGRGAQSAGQSARQSRRRPQDPSLHFDRPAREQVRHRPRRGTAPHSLAPRACPALEVVGIDCHIGSQIVEASPYVDALDRLLDLVEAVEGDGLSLAHIDLGGGLGITYADETPPPADALMSPPARANRCARPWPPEDRPRARALAGRQRRHPGERGALAEARQREELLHRRRRHERPDAAGDVRRLDGDRRVRAASHAGPRLRRRRAGLRVGRLARPRPLARRRAPATSSPCSPPAPTRMSMASNYNTRPRAAEVMVDGKDAWLDPRARDRRRPDARRAAAGQGTSRLR